MIRVSIQTIPHSKQRYNTVGDWVIDEAGNIVITISDLGDWRKEALVAVHELIEILLCKNDKISQKEVDEFDMEYELLRHPDDLVSEPGDSSKAPYRNQHFFATSIERLLCAQLKVDWKKYEESIYSLDYNPKPSRFSKHRK